MKFLMDFLKQKIPAHGTSMPAYYKKALLTSEKILTFYFLIYQFILLFILHRWVILTSILLVMTVGSIIFMDRMGLIFPLATFAAITLIWSFWGIRYFGWDCGLQHFLFPLLILCFFYIYAPSWLKIFCFSALIAFRMLLFAHALAGEPIMVIDNATRILFQTINSLITFVILACLCIIFSTSIQDTERQLLLDNEELHKEAGTDPLTQLPNRRAMLNTIARFRKKNPMTPYSVAIADIDFFKRVNDTYGHDCGDYTLKTLAKLFQDSAGSDYTVCRWGGEEFCFFLPYKNLDEAGVEMIHLCNAVRHMPLSFDSNDFSITVTIGVEEYDFASPVDVIIKEADKKLYMGKEKGRNQVVV